MILAQGAEAIIRKEKDVVRKERPVKGYRLHEIDEKLRKTRTRREANILKKLNDNNVAVPELISVDDKDMVIDMSFVEGGKLRDVLESNLILAKEVGRLVGQLHSLNIIHADLTTSNLLVKNSRVFLVDFGLSFVSTKVEDKAVDLHVLRHAMESTHHKAYEQIMKLVREGYKSTYPQAQEVFDRLEKVELRGRNKRK